MRGGGRGFLAGVITVLASMAIFVALLAHYAENFAGASGSFADRAVSVVQSSGVQSLIVDTVTNRVVEEAGGASSLRPEIESAVGDAVASPEVTAAVREAATSLQSQLTSGTATQLTLSLPDLGSSLAASVGSQSPLLAEELRNIGTVTVVDVPIPSSDESAIHDVTEVGADATLMLVLSVALIALALLVSPNRARTLRGLGIGALLSGLLAAAAYIAGRTIVVDRFSSATARTAVQAVWRTYLSGLEITGLVLAAVGLIVALVAATQARRNRY
jgi:hypothetical protein